MANKNKRAFYVNGEMLRKIIELKGLTQTDVYKAINIGENTIYRVIKYDRMENYEDFDKMCKYLDINPDLLLREVFDLRLDDNKEITIKENNVGSFLNELGYTNSYDKKFDEKYIHDFFKGAPQSDYLDPESEKFLFDKIIECRDKFSSMYFVNMIEQKTKDASVDNLSFYSSFDAWLKKNIRNKKL